MNTTPSDQWIARRLQSAAAAILLPPESRWVPREPRRAVPRLDFAMVAVVLALILAAYFALPGTRVVPAQQPVVPITWRGERPPAERADATVTLDDGSCRFSGPTTFVAGRIVIDVVNGSSWEAHVWLVALEPTATSPTSSEYDLAQIAEWMDQHRAAIAARVQFAEPPPVRFVQVDEAHAVPPGERGQLRGLVEPMTHVIFCDFWDPNAPPGPRITALDLIGPLQVVR